MFGVRSNQTANGDRQAQQSGIRSRGPPWRPEPTKGAARIGWHRAQRRYSGQDRGRHRQPPRGLRSRSSHRRRLWRAGCERVGQGPPGGCQHRARAMTVCAQRYVPSVSQSRSRQEERRYCRRAWGPASARRGRQSRGTARGALVRRRKPRRKPAGPSSMSVPVPPPFQLSTTLHGRTPGSLLCFGQLGLCQPSSIPS